MGLLSIYQVRRHSQRELGAEQINLIFLVSTYLHLSIVQVPNAT